MEEKKPKKSGKAKKAKKPAIKQEATPTLDQPVQEKPVENTEMPATEKKKEKPKQAQGNWLKENAIALVLAIVLVGVAGYALMNAFPEPTPVDISDFHNTNVETEPEIVKFFMVYNKDCKKCEIDSSFVLLLGKNGIKYDGQKYNASGEEGKEFIDELGLEKLPATIIDGESLTDNMIIRSDPVLQIGTPTGIITLNDFLILLSTTYPNEVKYSSAGNFFIIQELSLDGKNHIDFLPNTETCLPEEEGKVARVDIFTDPYSAPYIKSLGTINKIREERGEELEINYHYWPIEASRKFNPQIPWGNIENFGRYLVCANEWGILPEAESLFYARYCTLDDNNVLSSVEMENCSDSSRFGAPLLGGDTDKIVKSEPALEMFTDKEKFGTCLVEFPEIRDASAALAQQLQVFRVPTVVVNCKYTGHTTNIEKLLCEANPELCN